MPNPTKIDKVRELSERLTASEAAVFAGYRGLTVHDAGDLRSTLAEVDTRFAVVKNTLAKLALKEFGLEGLEPFVDGPTAIAFVGSDPVTAAKRLLEASRRYPVLELKGGFAEGRVLSAEQIRALATLESREVMLAKFAGLAKSQMGRMAWMLQSLQSRFLSLLEAYGKKLAAEEGVETPAPEAAPEAESVPAEAAEAEPEMSAEERPAASEREAGEETPQEEPEGAAPEPGDGVASETADGEEEGGS
jgi:large subunit ribosomal protein L10